MEAVVFNGANLTLKYESKYPLPKIVEDNDVIVKVHYAGICGTDLHIIQGEFPARKDRPLAMGHEFSGVITEVGKATQFKVGQKVVVDPNSACHRCDFCRSGKYQYCLTAGINNTIGIWRDGGWAEYVRCPDTNVFALPDEITTEQGNLWVTALHHQGHREVTVSEMNKSRLDIVKKLNTGYRLISPDVLAKEDKLYDVIVDCTGVGKVMEMNFNHLNHGGKYVLFGCCPPTHQATINPFQIYNKEVTVIGIKINPFTFPKTIGWLKAMGERYLNYENLGIKTYKLSEYQKALDDMKAGTISKALFKLVK
ncbi:uncharacterized protein LOC134660485 isoform X2 [Cydia amplana]|uniref:uncharacterized protein LOC134660485 isoform X2 n=1 Tax=Cydia amplana TaxID=1869771 RepID=UPI002FE6929E